MEFYVRYNAQEGKLTENVTGHFRGYLIDGPILEYYISAFSQLLLRTGKSFAVDPHTFDLKSDKPSHVRYISKVDVDEQISQIPTDKTERQDFVEKFLSFQERRVNETLLEDPLEEITEMCDPEFLIPPYLIVDEAEGDIQSLNLDFISDSRLLRKDATIYASLTLTKDILIQKKELEKIVKAYSSCEVNGLCISTVNFDVYSESVEYLRGYASMIKQLSALELPIISTHGSFFDLLIKEGNIEAIVHGADSGDRLRITSPGFGRRQYSRYYVNAFKKRYSGAELDYIQKNTPELLKCDCGYCDDIQVRESQVNHYLASRAKEVEEYNNGKDLLTEIKETYDKYTKYSGVLGIDHLQRWISAIENHKSKS